MIQCWVAVSDEVADPRKAEVLIFERDKVLPLFGCQSSCRVNLSVQGLSPAILGKVLAGCRSLPTNDGFLAAGAAEFDDRRTGNSIAVLSCFHCF